METAKASVDEPEIPQLVESQDGIEIVEDEQQRFMPLESSLRVGAVLPSMLLLSRHVHACLAQQHALHATPECS